MNNPNQYHHGCRSECGGEPETAVTAPNTLTVVWRRLLQDAETCPRCGSTEHELQKAVAELQAKARCKNIEVILEKEAIPPEEFQRDPTRSNTILLNGIPLEQVLNAKTGASKCCGVCGDAECRTVQTDSGTYEVIPAELIVRAGMALLGVSSGYV